MNLSDLLNSPIGQSIVQNVAGQFDLNESQASTAVNAAIPVIISGLGKIAQTSDGAESLNKALETKHDGSLLDKLAAGALGGGNLDALLQDGGGILGHVFGNNVGSVQSGISQKTGISVDKMGPIIKMLAPIVMAYLGKEKTTNNVSAGGLGDLLGGMLGGITQQKSSGSGIFDLVSGILDKDKDGSALDDIIGMFSNRK